MKKNLNPLFYCLMHLTAWCLALLFAIIAGLHFGILGCFVGAAMGVLLGYFASINIWIFVFCAGGYICVALHNVFCWIFRKKAEKSDLDKYPEFQLFFDAAGEFDCGETYLNGLMKLTFELKEPSDAETFFANLNGNAMRGGWQSEKRSGTRWAYTREPTLECVEMQHQPPIVRLGVWRPPINQETP